MIPTHDPDPFALVCATCIAAAGGSLHVVVEEEAGLILEVTGLHVPEQPARTPRHLPYPFGARWLAFAASLDMEVRWASGDRWRPRGITARNGALLCEYHALRF